MDKRYLKLIADNFPYAMPKKFTNGITICFVAAGLGFLMLVANKDYTMVGFGIGVASAMGMITFGLLSYAYRKKQAKKFIADYEATGKLPEWPEHHEKDTLQTNN